LGERIAGLAKLVTGVAFEDFFTLDGSGTADKDAAAWAPLSIAGWDAAARMHGVPLAQLLNPDAAGAVAVNALIGGRQVEAVREAALAARQEGFGAVKLKVGLAASVEEEMRRVAACREAMGPGVKLRLDANGAWEEDRAMEVLAALASYDIEYVEQPVAAGRLGVLRRVREASPVRVAADEDVTDGASAALVLQAEAADVLVLKPLQSGGVVGSCMVTTAAAAAGAAVTLTTSIDSGIGTAAALQLAAATAPERAHGLATLSLLADDLVLTPGLVIVNGRMRLPDAPGLGVELDEAALAGYATGEQVIEA
jgi:L-alanine-DL-glutamate epimerase-like enolase superfamily enzyme